MAVGRTSSLRAEVARSFGKHADQSFYSWRESISTLFLGGRSPGVAGEQRLNDWFVRKAASMGLTAGNSPTTSCKWRASHIQAICFLITDTYTATCVPLWKDGWSSGVRFLVRNQAAMPRVRAAYGV